MALISDQPFIRRYGLHGTDQAQAVQFFDRSRVGHDAPSPGAWCQVPARVGSFGSGRSEDAPVRESRQGEPRGAPEARRCPQINSRLVTP
jgi:hypothetical protein